VHAEAKFAGFAPAKCGGSRRRRRALPLASLRAVGQPHADIHFNEAVALRDYRITPERRACRLAIAGEAIMT
jgi:hypothetical protein